MAKKKEKDTFKNASNSKKWFLLLNSFSKNKEISNDEFIAMSQEVINHIINRKLDPEAEVVFSVDNEKEEILLLNKNTEVVEDSEAAMYDELLGISYIGLSKAKEVNKNAKVGDLISYPIEFNSFDQKNLVAMRNGFSAAIAEKAKNRLFAKYHPLIGSKLMVQIASKHENGGFFLKLGDGTSAYLPKNSIIKSVELNPGQKFDVFLNSVNIDAKGLYLEVTMTSPEQVRDVLFREIPEIANGDLIIRNIQRVPGERSKVVVSLNPEKQSTHTHDLLGAMFGNKAQRINDVSKSLNNEKIDVIRFAENPKDFIRNAMSPCPVVDVVKSKKGFYVIVRPEDVSLAIGSNGVNVSLASKVTNNKIDVLSTEQAFQEKIYFQDNYIPVHYTPRERNKNNFKKQARERASFGFDFGIEEFSKDVANFISKVELEDLLKEDKAQEAKQAEVAKPATATSVKKPAKSTKLKTEAVDFNAYFDETNLKAGALSDEYSFVNKLDEYQQFENEFSGQSVEEEIKETQKQKVKKEKISAFSKNFKIDEDLLNYGLSKDLDLSDLDDEKWKK
ncbi:transcription elongation factor NusA [Mycoplasma synoviae GX11-T]|nr:transcription termination/antitermination protein NusA [Mycoplasmopsis synoviae]MBD5788476.1 transcription elongation factor NusA [Mycoplasmopsis synoviae GX11-T]